jgi:beta-xylosidase
MVNIHGDDWYYIAFMDSFPSGRIPVMAPLSWDTDGWPQLVTNSSGSWNTSYPAPVFTTKTVPPLTGTDQFDGVALSHEWEWNHNPDPTKWSLAGGVGGLVLQTATVTDDLFSARNTITHRIIGPRSDATFEFDISMMADGDRAGAVLFRDMSAYIGIHKSGNISTLVYVTDLNLDSTWNTASTGVVAATGPDVNGPQIYLRISVDITPAFGLDPVREATFSYSTDGSGWIQLGGPFLLNNDWTYFTGYRYAAFNFATLGLGGQVTFKSFSMELAR